MRRLVLVSAWLILVVSTATSFIGAANLISQSRMQAATRCQGPRRDTCWVEASGTVDGAPDCGDAACTVNVAVTLDGATRRGHMLVQGAIGKQLHADEPVLVRLLDHDLLRLHADGGVDVDNGELAPGARWNAELALAIATSIAILCWLAIGKLRSRHKATRTTWTESQWAHFGYGTLIVWGIVGLGLFATIGARTLPFVRAYEAASPCATPAHDCRLRVNAVVAQKQCTHDWYWSCALQLRYDGPQGTATASATFLRENVESVGKTVAMELFGDEVTRLFVAGRDVVPEGAPETRLRSVEYCAASALGLVAWGLIGLARRRRATRPNRT